MSISDLKTDLSFTEGELKLLELFEGEERANIAKSILEKKHDLMAIHIEKSINTANSITSFMKDITLAILNGIDKVPAVIDSYNKLKQTDSEIQSES